MIRIFSHKFIKAFHAHEKDLLFYVAALIFILVILAGFLLQRATTELRVGFVTNLGVCSQDVAFDQSGFTQKVQNFITSTDEKRVHFNGILGNSVLYEKEKCEDRALDDFAWTRTLLEARDNAVFALGPEDLISKRESYKHWLSFTDRLQTYYSFDRKNTHIIVLDTVLGGDAMSLECEDIPACEEHNHRWQFLRTLLKDPTTLADYLERNNTTEDAVREERKQERAFVAAQEFVIDQTRSKSRRREGRIGDSQLRWLREDLAKTHKERVLVLSHHPLFFVDEGGKKPIDINNRDSVTLIFKESGKDIVSVSGGTKNAHQHTDANIRYFSIPPFNGTDTPWATLSWSAQSLSFEQR